MSTPVDDALAAIDPEQIRITRCRHGAGVWMVRALPGLALTRSALGWQLSVVGAHPELPQEAVARGEALRRASRMLVHRELLHRRFRTRQEGVTALRADLAA